MTEQSAGQARFIEGRSADRQAAPRPAFGGPVNLLRLFLMRRESMPVVCIACRTMNSRTARTCIGCAGKLPAYFAGVGEPAHETEAGRTAQWLPPHWPDIAPRWRLVMAAAALLVLSAVAFQAWFVVHAAAVRSRPMVSAVMQPAGSHPSSGSLRSSVEAFVAEPVAQTASLEPVRFDPQPVAPVIVTPLPPHQANRKTGASEPAVQRVSAGGAIRHPGSAQGADPLAGCRSLWFLARAACLNDSCARAPLKRHPQCQQVVAQRRLDEARRDRVVSN